MNQTRCELHPDYPYLCDRVDQLDAERQALLEALRETIAVAVECSRGLLSADEVKRVRASLNRACDLAGIPHVAKDLAAEPAAEGGAA